MNRFFVEKKNITPTTIVVTDAKDVHHLAKVLRVPPGEELFISDGEGGGYLACVERITRDAVVLAVTKELVREKRQDRKILISLACAVPKNASFEDIVDKCTQLGADEIIPLLTERTLIALEAYVKKEERVRRVMIAAAKQSGVLFLPQLRPAVRFSHFLESSADYDLKLLPNLSRQPVSLEAAVKNFTGKRVLVLIGPEGDFTAREIDEALGVGCLGVTLGESVLRVDTAAVAAVSFLRIHFSDISNTS